MDDIGRPNRASQQTCRAIGKQEYQYHYSYLEKGLQLNHHPPLGPSCKRFPRSLGCFIACCITFFNGVFAVFLWFTRRETGESDTHNN